MLATIPLGFKLILGAKCPAVTTNAAVYIPSTEIEHLGHWECGDIHNFASVRAVRRNKVHDSGENVFDQNLPVLLLPANTIAYFFSFLFT
jgi:hypothetical protein